VQRAGSDYLAGVLPAISGLAAMVSQTCPVRWVGRHVVMELPEHVDVSNAGQIREELLSAINRGAQSLIADMTATISCDNAGADAVARAYQRATISGTELRLVVTAQIVRRVIGISGSTASCRSTRRWKPPPPHGRRQWSWP
jgi:anti-anti-sigma factor